MQCANDSDGEAAPLDPGHSLRNSAHQAGFDRVETRWHDSGAGAVGGLNGLNPAMAA